MLSRISPDAIYFILLDVQRDRFGAPAPLASSDDHTLTVSESDRNGILIIMCPLFSYKSY